MRSLLALVGLLVLSSGCESAPTAAPAPADPSAAARLAAVQPQGAVVGHIQWRDGRVTITTGDEGPRYSVASLDGAWLARDLSYEQLAERYPEVEPMVRSSTASTRIDASVDAVHQGSPRDDRDPGGPKVGPALHRLDF